MSKEAVLRNAYAVIEQHGRNAKEGKDFSQASIDDAKRSIELVKVADKLTEDEIAMLRSKHREPNPVFSECKGIKEGHALSWGELKLLSSML